MKVYVLEFADGECGNLIGIFATAEAAMAEGERVGGTEAAPFRWMQTHAVSGWVDDPFSWDADWHITHRWRGVPIPDLGAWYVEEHEVQG